METYTSKVVFLHRVRGPDIGLAQEEINKDPNRRVVASQIIPNGTSPECGNTYDCWIYYNEKSNGVKGL